MLPRRIAALAPCFVWVMLCVARCAAAQSPQAVVPRPGLPSAQTVSVAAYRAHLAVLQMLVAQCGSDAAACDASQVGEDDLVQPARGAAYTERYGWLRDLMEDRNDPAHALRREMLPRAAQRLAEQVVELDAGPAQVDGITAAERTARDAVLRRGEFRTAGGYSLTERISAWLSEQFAKLFTGASSLGRAAPWLGAALQWGALLAAVLLMVLWVYRALDRQRIALGRLRDGGTREAALAASRAWASQAQRHAERGEWREAVHALYWASIVVLEDRRTLRRSGTRTPREALQLIDASSPLGALLRAQTGSFERIWYGLQPADAGDYEQARVQYEAMRDARAQPVSIPTAVAA